MYYMLQLYCAKYQYYIMYCVLHSHSTGYCLCFNSHFLGSRYTAVVYTMPLLSFLSSAQFYLLYLLFPHLFSLHYI